MIIYVTCQFASQYLRLTTKYLPEVDGNWYRALGISFFSLNLSEDNFHEILGLKIDSHDNYLSGNHSREGYLNIAGKAKGYSIPIVYSYLYALSGVVTWPRVDTGHFILPGYHCNALVGDVFKEDGTPVAGSIPPNNSDDGRVYIQDASESDFIYTNIQGRTGISGGFFENPIESLSLILPIWVL